MAKDEQKIQGERVVRTPAIVLPEGHFLIDLLRADQYIVVPKGQTEVGQYNKKSPYANLVVNPVDAANPNVIGKDTPDLSDITVYTPLTRKQRAGSNDFYYEIVYKVRNSSLNPSDVIGVDARIVGTEPQND